MDLRNLIRMIESEMYVPKMFIVIEMRKECKENTLHFTDFLQTLFNARRPKVGRIFTFNELFDVKFTS